MDYAPFPFFTVVVGMAGLVQLVWHIAVIVFVYKIWQKVKHLPG